MMKKRKKHAPEELRLRRLAFYGGISRDALRVAHARSQNMRPQPNPLTTSADAADIKNPREPG